MTVREEIADAVSTVDGVDGHPYFTQGTHPGHTYLRIDRIEYPNKFGGICFWNVVVILPQDMAEAERYIEETVPLIKAAVEPHLTVTETVPQVLSITGVGDQLCVFINGHREE